MERQKDKKLEFGSYLPAGRQGSWKNSNPNDKCQMENSDCIFPPLQKRGYAESPRRRGVRGEVVSFRSGGV